jgi:hypothetical protein
MLIERHLVDLVKILFVNKYAENWFIKYNQWLWEYFDIHGKTPNGEPLVHAPNYGKYKKGKEL